MERIQQLKHAVMQSTQQLQEALDAKDYGHLSTGVAAALMFLVFCPMSIVAVAGAYWTYSVDAHGATVSTSVSIWTVSASTEIGGKNKDSEMDMCGETMQGFVPISSEMDMCGDKIHTLRFFTITALFLSFASSSMLFAAFLPFLKDKAWLRDKILLVGTSLAGLVWLWNFLSMCIAAGVDVGEGYSLNGAGFVFIVLELLFVVLALVPTATKAMRQRSSSDVSKPSSTDNAKEYSQPSHHAHNAPILLGGRPKTQISTEIDKKTEQPEAIRGEHGRPTAVVADASGQNLAKGRVPKEQQQTQSEESMV